MNIKMANSAKAEGLFYTAHPIYGSVISKNFNFIEEENQENLNQEEPSHLLEPQEFVYFSVENLEKPPFIDDMNSFVNPKLNDNAQTKKKKDKLKTDAEISTKTGQNVKKDLVKWEGEVTETVLGMSLDNYAHKMDSWNQFEANKNKFGIDFHFKEEEYTTKLDITKIDPELKKKAEQLERELMNEDSVEARHILEERGKVELCEDFDEEKKFSAVLGSGRYVDPKAVAENKEIENKGKITSGPPRFINKKKTQEQSNANLNIKDSKTAVKKEENETKNPLEQEKNKNIEKIEKNDISNKNEKDEKNNNIKVEEIDPLRNEKKSSENVKNNTSQQNIEKTLENNEESSLKTNSNSFEKSSSLGLKGKKNIEKSLKLNSDSFFAGVKLNPNNITEFKPENIININETTTELSQKSQKEEAFLIENTSKPLTSSKIQQSEQFKLNPTDAHLSIKFKCKNISPDANHNSKKLFGSVLLESYEKSKENYNVALNDTTWKKIKIENKEIKTKPIINETAPTMNTDISNQGFQPTMNQQAFYPTNTMMYTPMAMNPVGNYGYGGNMYAPMQNYGYSMGYNSNYGYQGASYVNPMMGQQMKFYGSDPSRNNFNPKK